MQKIGKFTILRPLASGGMADIFLAKRDDTFASQLFVIKRIADSVGDKWYYSKLFLREAQLSISFNHPNLVQTYEVGSLGEDLYLVQEYIDGENLREIFKGMEKRKTTFTATMLSHLMSEISLGLSYLHGEISMGVNSTPQVCVHRDISPHNIMLSRSGDVKIIDFGITKSNTSDSLTSVGSLRGKYAYMSPEQARGHDLTPATDIFSLGIIYYEFITGRRFFENLQERELIQTLEQWSNKDIEKRLSDVSGDSKTILRGMLADDPAQRPSALKLKSVFETQLKTLDGNYGKEDFNLCLRDYIAEFSAPSSNPPTAQPTHLTLYDVLTVKETKSPRVFAWLMALILFSATGYYISKHPGELNNILRTPATVTAPQIKKYVYSKSLLLKFSHPPGAINSQIEVNGRTLDPSEIQAGLKVVDGDIVIIKTQDSKSQKWKEHRIVVDTNKPPSQQIDL